MQSCWSDGFIAGREPACRAHRRVAHRQRTGIGQHVGSISDQRQRAGNPAANCLGDHESGRDPQRPQQRSLAGTAAMGVAVMRVVMVPISASVPAATIMVMVIDMTMVVDVPLG